MADNLDLPQVAGNQNQKEVTINDATLQLSGALADYLVVDLSAGDDAVTTSDFQQYMAFVTSGNSVSRTLTLPHVKRALFMAENGGTSSLNVVVGSTTVVLAPGDFGFFQTDGATNGLVQLQSSATFNGTIAGKFKLTGVITDTLTATTTDWAPTGLTSASVIRFTTNAERLLIQGITGGSEGRVLILENSGSHSALFQQNVGTAANRITALNDTLVDAGQALVLKYDGTASRWRVIAAPVAIRFMLPFWIAGVMTNGEKVVSLLATQPFKLTAADATAFWVANADTASTGTATLTLKKNGSSIGTVDFVTSSTGAITFSTDVSFAVNDILDVIAPATADATLAGVRIALTGQRN